MAKPTVYIETSVLSYLAARPSRDLVAAANQQVTRDFWDKQLDDFDVFVSTTVVLEASSGDVVAAQRRLEAIATVTVLAVDNKARDLALALVQRGVVPVKAAQDVVHIAVAAVNKIDYLLTWNFKHIANATMREAISQVVREAGYTPSVICTPAELGEIGGDLDVE